MRCTECERRTIITETRTTSLGIRRRHKCTSCNHRFTTVEITMGEYLSIVERLKKVANSYEEIRKICEKG